MTYFLDSNVIIDLLNGNKLDDDDDILIGSLAVRHNAILVTNNINHLSRIKDIKLVNWRD